MEARKEQNAVFKSEEKISSKNSKHRQILGIIFTKIVSRKFSVLYFFAGYPKGGCLCLLQHNPWACVQVESTDFSLSSNSFLQSFPRKINTSVFFQIKGTDMATFKVSNWKGDACTCVFFFFLFQYYFLSLTQALQNPKLARGRLQSPNLPFGQLSTCCISPASLLLSQRQIEYRKFPKYWFGFVELKMYVPVRFAKHFQNQGKYKEEKGGGGGCSAAALQSHVKRLEVCLFIFFVKRLLYMRVKPSMSTSKKVVSRAQS